jgi:excisionase family DNA binding protein
VTIPEAAAALGLAPSTLRHQIKNHKLKAHKMGGLWYVNPAEVERYSRESQGKHQRSSAA